MAKRISDLPISATAVGTDEDEVNQGGVSKRQALNVKMAYYKANIYDQTLDTTDGVEFTSVTTPLVFYNGADITIELASGEGLSITSGTGIITDNDFYVNNIYSQAATTITLNDTVVLSSVANDNSQTQLLVLNSSTNQIEYRDVSSLGGGDVVGPASSTDNALVRYDGTTGKLVQNSDATLDNFGNAIFTGDVSVGSDLITDFISESTLNAGVQVDGLEIKDQSIDRTTSGTLSIGANNATSISCGAPIELENLTTAARTGLTPSAGWIVFDTDLNQFFGYNGTSWVILG